MANEETEGQEYDIQWHEGQEYDIQWHVERIADEVTGLSEGKLLVLFFDITSPRTFHGTLNGTGPEASVKFAEDMQTAVVTVAGVESRTVSEAEVPAEASTVAETLVRLIQGEPLEDTLVEMDEISRNRLVYAAVSQAHRTKSCAFCQAYAATGAHSEGCPVYPFDPPNVSGEPMESKPSVFHATMVTAEITAEAYTTTVWSHGEIIASRTMKLTPTGAHAAQKGDFYDDFQEDGNGDREEFVEALENVDSAGFDVAQKLAEMS